jgi:transketolase
LGNPIGKLTLDAIKFANQIRLQSIRLTTENNASHLGSIFSVADIISVIYSDFISTRESLNPENCVLSKGHAGLAVYIALNLIGQISDEELNTYYKNGSNLSGHLSHNNVRGILFSTGSLGHGLPFSIGKALSSRLEHTNEMFICILGDGELNEGTTWESALIASNLMLSNLLVIVDFNRMQSLGKTDEILALEPIIDKWESFGWEARRINGHDHSEISFNLNYFFNARNEMNKPLVVIADTIKGKGVSIMENQLIYHYKPLSSDNELSIAFKELNLTDES